MRFSLRTLVLSSAALCSTAAFAAPANQVRVDVPFNFVVKNHIYKAGTYKVEIEPAKFLVTLRRTEDPVQSGTWLVGPSDDRDSPTKVRLTFDRIGTERVLQTIQFGQLTTQNLDARSKQKLGETRIDGE